MKLKNCKDCYYEGREKCFLYDKKFEDLKVKECTEGFLDPYKNYNEAGELCKSCWYYQSDQCLGNKIAKENCLMGY